MNKRTKSNKNRQEGAIRKTIFLASNVASEAKRRMDELHRNQSNYIQFLILEDAKRNPSPREEQPA